jgi:SAM-dependent methyltransferase
LLRPAIDLLTPQASVPATSKLRGVRIRAQRLLFRALRPYWFGQRQASMLVIDAVQAVDRSLATQSASIQQAVLRELTGIHARIERLDVRVASLDGRIEELGAQAAESRRAPALEALQETVSGFQTTAAAHLAALTDAVSRLEREAEDTTNRLYPVPYMSNPDLLSHTDEQGRRVLGFREPASGRSRYVGFEDIFRGSEEFVRNRFRGYLPLLAGSDPVVDVGCGRGELLDLLREAGQQAVGVDSNEDMVSQCRQRGLDVTLSDGVEFLLAQPASSLGAIVASHVIEHLSYEATMAFFDAAIAKLKPGGLLLVETVNPHSLEALKGFWTDLTHRHPIFPEVALALCWLRRFQSADVLFPHGSGDFESDRRTQGEYAVVARKAPTS